ncbi:MAG: undecaprenyldiphospho-muramoylpentapeptide beta-N-acetylglucosaminyltransferase [Bacteroidetes bacterium]|nr:undecaprenyldiphospho-muramoylpentapeptide beta-N-acetylglucosaminyltransferase [Bacteroidota bacterium]
MENNRNIKVIISGGGTGGHVFPAIAIANALTKKETNIDILFVGAKDKMEMKKVPAAGYKIIGLSTMGFQRRMTYKNLFFPFKLLSALLKSRNIIRTFKPDVVVGVGGYASGPILKVAVSKGIPTLIQEQNSFPGITNRILSKKVNKICVAYNGMENYFPASKIILTGNPVRQDAVMIENKKKEALEYFGLTSDKKVLLAIGGSLGARTINESVYKNMKFFSENNIQVIWQTGMSFYETARASSVAYGNNAIKPFYFIDRMDLAYAAADIIVSRAGAISVSELCIVGKPAILVPSPNVAEDHQTKNAQALIKINAAIIIEDTECKENLGKKIVELLDDEEKCITLGKNIKTLALVNADDNIADEILNLIEEK